MGGASNTNPGSAVNLDAFLAAIRAEKADDAPRLVLADWLTERGNPHGELIVLQCTRSRLEREGLRATAQYRRVFRREKELVGQIMREPYDRRPVNVNGLARGCPTHIQASGPDFRTRWASAARWPIETVAFGKEAPLGAVAWLARQPNARSLHTIGVHTPTGSLALEAKAVARSDLREDDERLVWPVDEAPAPSVKGALVRIHFNAAGGALARFCREIAPNLVEISFMGADRGMAVALANGLPNVQKLSGWLEPKSALDFLEHLQPGKLKNFALQGYQKQTFDAEGSRRLAASAILAQLTNLIADVPLDPALAGALSTRATSLEVLSPGAGLTDEGLAAFAASEVPRRLRWLRLKNERNVTSLVPLAEAPFARIESLTLEGFRIDDDAARALARNPGLAGLVDLKLVACPMKPPAAAILADSPYLGALLEPKLIHCRLFHETMTTITARWPDASFTQDV